MRHTECYRKDYPRPQLVRNDWNNLNGAWDFAFDHDNSGETRGWQHGFAAKTQIVVPYAYQSPRSLVNVQTRCDTVWYQTRFTPAFDDGEALLIHFEGCDHTATVWVNGKFVGSHTGGYARFTVDATLAAESGKENLLVVRAEDSYSCRYPRGKQRAKDANYGCWYADTTGLYKTVWTETVNRTHIDRVEIRTDSERVSVRFECAIKGAPLGVTLHANVRFDGRECAQSSIKVRGDRVVLELDLACNAHEEEDFLFATYRWSAQSPHLYDVTLTLTQDNAILDTVGSYFGMVKYRAERNAIYVNDAQVYLKMLLDQGYWQDSHLTPPDEEAIERDVLLTLEAGFNGIRKHQKIEDERFYYYCDVLGVYAWCEMPSLYEFCTESVEAFTREWLEIVAQMRNHPCIMAWVPFNESWGVPQIHADRAQQRFTESAYYLTKTLDPERFVISNDGWDHTVSDLVTLHNYAEYGDTFDKVFGDLKYALEGKTTNPPVYRQPFALGYHYSGQPVLMSEYGGIAYGKDREKGWGYGQLVSDEASFLARLDSLTSAIKRLDGVCGYCLTQTTDVQQEVNGILTEDRKWKADPTKIRAINDKL